MDWFIPMVRSQQPDVGLGNWHMPEWHFHTQVSCRWFKPENWLPCSYDAQEFLLAEAQ